MPYNTRRKSVSLASLGISVPATGKLQRPSPSDANEQPPSKRVKRSHNETVVVRPNLGPTPPPSPHSHQDQHINYEDIDDEIVSTVVKVLERSGNRPHTARELVNVLAGRSGVALIDRSANPHAIISSRLNTYLKRKDFSDEKPCVMDKELIVTHPKRTYFFLTTTEHQPIPEHFETPAPIRAVVSPAPTEEADEEEEESAEEERRRRMPSPSPEIEFLDHDREDDDEEMDDASSSIFSRERTGSPISSSRNSPPLEGDEQEFSDSAISLSIKHRSRSQDLRDGVPTPPLVIDEEDSHIEHEHHTTFLGTYNMQASSIPHPSPVVRPVSPCEAEVAAGKAEDATPSSTSATNPKSLEVITTFRLNRTGDDSFDAWGGDLKSPETVDLHELDDLLGGL